MIEDDKNIEKNEVEKISTKAENLLAWKELLSSNEAKEFVSELIDKTAVLFGQTSRAKVVHTVTNVILMLVAFGCVGALSYFKLVPEGTTGVLSGIIIGYFFKKE